MEFDITCLTPGSHISPNTLNETAKDLTKIIENSMIDAIASKYPGRKTSVKKIIKGKTKFFIHDIKKGSWLIALIGATGGILANSLVNVEKKLIDFDNELNALKNEIKDLSLDIVNLIENNLKQINKISVFIVKNCKIEKQIKNNGIVKVFINLELDIDKAKLEIDFDSNNQIEQFMITIKLRQEKNFK